MNALLLSALGSAGPQKNTLSTTSTQGAQGVFAQILGAQSEQTETDLLSLLQQLGLDDQDLSALAPQLKDYLASLDLNDPNLQQLLHKAKTQFQRLVPNQDSLAANDAAESLSPPDYASATALVQATLQVAHEANHLQTRTAFNPLAPKAKTQPLSALDQHLQADPNSLGDRHSSANTKSRFTSELLATDATTTRFDSQARSAHLAATAHTSFTDSTHSQSTASTTDTLSTTLGLTGSASTGSAAPTYTALIQSPISATPQWNTEFGRVVVNMAQHAQNTGPQTAEIRLAPPELGPLRIVLSVQDQVAHATIFAAHAQTRQAVEQALGQLQQQLNQAGLSLGEANVSDQGFSAHSQQQSQQDSQQGSARFSLEGGVQSTDNSLSSNSDQASHPQQPDGIIDTFA